MNRLRRITAVTTGVIVSLLALLTTPTASYAWIPPPKIPPTQAEPTHTVTTLTNSGMAGWEIGLIAVSAAVFASALTVLVLRARSCPNLRPATP